jgi:hypothetical protein
MAGIHTMSDKHIAISKAELDGLARPGQIVVDADDYSLWVGNDDGDLISAGGGGGGGGSSTPAGPTGALQFVGADGDVAGTGDMIYEPDYQQLTIGPSITNDDGSEELVGSIATGYIYADKVMAGKMAYSITYVEQGAYAEDDGTGTNTSIVDLNKACYFKMDVPVPVTLTLVSYSIEGPFVSRFTLEITGGSTGVTWWPGAKWSGGTAPVLSGGVDIIEFITDNGGSSTVGYVLASDVA